MRSPLPIFLLVGLALFAVIGIAIFGSAATTAVAQVNNTTTEEMPLTVYGAEYGIVFGIAALLIIIAAYFALRTFL